MDDANEKIIQKLINDMVIEKESELMGFGCKNSHVHLLVRMPPRITGSEINGEIKAYSSCVLVNKIRPERGF